MRVDMSTEAIGARLRAMDELWLLSVKLMNSRPVVDGDSTLSRRSQALEIQDAIRNVLYNDWDPLGINDYPSTQDEYDAYIAPVYRILVGNRSTEELVKTLTRIARDEIGVPAGDVEKLNSVTDKLLELKVTLD
jgi:hypothetical protein